MIETSQFLYQLWRDFSYWFCRINNLTDVAGYIFLPLFWAFVFFSLRKNSSRKKIWLAVALIYPAVLLVCFLITQMIFTDPLHCVLILIPYFVGIVLGNLFDTSKKWHWALVPILTLLTYSTVIFWKVYPPVFYPFAEIIDEPLQDVELDVVQNADYEIEMVLEDAWGDDSRVIAIRERNDSVFYRAAYRMCGPESNVDSTQWLPLNTEKASTAVKSLKNSIEKYEQEYHSDLVNDGYSVRVSLKDYKRKTSRRLGLNNASILGMQGAMAIENMMFDLMPPRETFTTLSYDEVSKKCSEPRNAFVDSIVHNQQNNTAPEQVKAPKRKDSFELNNSEKK